jgi:hypothetical protein
MENDRPLLRKIGITSELEGALRDAGFVIVPITPTAEMLKMGWYSANDEDAAGCWRDMVEAALNPSMSEIP